MSIEFKIFEKKDLYYLLAFLLSTIVGDIIYLLYFGNFWNVKLALDLPSLGLLHRKINVSLSLINPIIKFVIAFALWKMALENKLLTINHQHTEQLIQSQIENEFVKKNFRRKFNFSTKNSMVLRDFGNDFLP